MAETGSGVAFDFDEDEAEELCGQGASDWYAERIDRAMIGSDALLAASVADFPSFSQPGLYFIIVRDMICYVGQAGSIAERIGSHLREGRPIGKLAVILGIPKWAQSTFEHAYIRAWQPPWNVEKSRCGSLAIIPGLVAAAEALDKSAVAPDFLPVSAGKMLFYPKWRLWCAGYMQRSEADELADRL